MNYTRLYREIKKQTKTDDSFWSAKLGLKNSRSIVTSSAKKRYHEIIVNMFLFFNDYEPIDFWKVCENCGHYNLSSEIESQKTEVPNCGECERPLWDI